jgi:glucose-6-phosphate isomerase
VQDLTRRAGFAVAVDLVTGELRFSEGVVSDKPVARQLSELRTVLSEPSASGPDPGYRVYHDVRRMTDARGLASAGLRYDLTVTRPGTMGRELVKTAGHVHRPAPSGFRYAEIYEVIHGRAAFLLQQVERQAGGWVAAGEGWLLLAGAGEAILIPGELGHLTINVGAVPLVVGDLVAIASSNDYRPFQERRGAAWYVEPDSWSPIGIRVIPNSRYSTGPLPKVLRASSSAFSFANGPPLFRLAASHPAKFEFLTD